MKPGRASRVLLAGVLLVWLGGLAHAATMRVRSGNHPGFGRVVIDATGHTRYALQEDGDTVTVFVEGAVTLLPPRRLPRNVLAIRADGSVLHVTLRHGARLRPARIHGLIVLDALNPPRHLADAPGDERRPEAGRPEAGQPEAGRGHAGRQAAGREDGGHHTADGAREAGTPDIGWTAQVPSRMVAANAPGPMGGGSIVPVALVRLARVRLARTDETVTPVDRLSKPSRDAAEEGEGGRSAGRRTAKPATHGVEHSSQPATAAGRVAGPAPRIGVVLEPSAPGETPVRLSPSLLTGPLTLPAARGTAAAAVQPAQNDTAAPTGQAGALAQPAPRTPVEAAPMTPGAPMDTGTGSSARIDSGPPVGERRRLAPGRDVMPEDHRILGLRAHRIDLPPGMKGAAILLPFDPSAGAAAFEEGGSTYIVVDERRPVDMGGLVDNPVFRAASVRMLANGTLVQVPHPAGTSVTLTRLPHGWRVAELAAAPRLKPIVARAVHGRLRLRADAPGHVVNMADPATGATLLVGTLHDGGEGVRARLQTADLILHRSGLGVVVEPLWDAVTMRVMPHGFALDGGANGLHISPDTKATAALIKAAHLTTRLRFASMPMPALRHLEKMQILAAALAPSLARGPRNEAAARTLISMGMGVEAQGLLHLAAEEDPHEAASPDVAALSAIAALLAGRVADSGGLLDRRLDGTDDIALWRGVRLAMLDRGSAKAAAILASTAPLVFRYPAAIHDRILPLITETMIEGGQPGAAAQVLADRPDDPRLGYARALLQEEEGHTKRALRAYDALANGHDQFASARAAVRAVALRLKKKMLTKRQAADAFDRLLYAWRGDQRELALRERIAALRAQTGQWTRAMDMLRRTERDFPSHARAIRTSMKALFEAMLRDQSKHPMAPLKFVALVRENTDLLTDPGESEAMQQALADKLLALDLPDQARPVLTKLMREASSGGDRARFGASLAALEARDGHAHQALAALDASAVDGIPPGLLERRLILRAKAMAATGSAAKGAALLVPLHTPRAAAARGQILEGAKDWTGAEAAWTEDATLTLPADGALNRKQARLVLRLATATSRAGDEAGLATLRASYMGRLPKGPAADLFRLLTAQPIRDAADLERLRGEAGLAASLPADLKALQPAPATN